MSESNLGIDSHKLMFHPERIDEWMKKGDCPPIYLEIGLTNICNHKCIFCGLDWAKGTSTLDTDVLLENLKDMAEFGVKSVCFSGAGEPSLHKDFELIVKKTKEFGIDVAFSTNIALFDEEKAKATLPYTTWIRFSLDAGTPKTHAFIHGTSESDFDKIIENLKKAVEIKKKNNYPVTLGVQFILLEENADELLKAAELCRNIGVDNLQVKPYSHVPNSFNNLSVDYNKFAEIAKKLESFSNDNFKVIYRASRAERIEKKQDYQSCHGLPFFAIINEKGDVQPCHIYYGNSSFSFGNIYKDKFSDIWRSNQRKEVIERINKSGISGCRKGCRLDAINIYLHRLKNPGLHDNFV